MSPIDYPPALLYPYSHLAVVLPTFRAEWIALAGISSSSPSHGWWIFLAISRHLLR
jgi:hypothetical protein